MNFLKRPILALLIALQLNPSKLAYLFQATKLGFLKMIDRRTNRKKLLINIGGSNFYKRHWLVMDYRHPESRHYDFVGMDFNYDLMGGEAFPLADSSVSLFYSSNTLEHIQDEHLEHVFREAHRCLKPGGGFRIQVPDFDYLYAAMKIEDHSAVMNLTGDGGFNRYGAMVAVHGEAHARKTLKNWPDQGIVKTGPFTKEEVAFEFLNDFAGHLKGSYGYDQIMADIRALTKGAFTESCTNGVDIAWKRQNPKEHTNWLNDDKLIAGLRAAGFSEAHSTEPFHSRFEEMRGVGKYWGFDHRRPHSSCFVEAIK
jgi:SAM-dependent methyltransferase